MYSNIKNKVINFINFSKYSLNLYLKVINFSNITGLFLNLLILGILYIKLKIIYKLYIKYSLK
jgi:hypothetical protein